MFPFMRALPCSVRGALFAYSVRLSMGSSGYKPEDNDPTVMNEFIQKMRLARYSAKDTAKIIGLFMKSAGSDRNVSDLAMREFARNLPVRPPRIFIVR